MLKYEGEKNKPTGQKSTFFLPYWVLAKTSLMNKKIKMISSVKKIKLVLLFIY